MEVRKIKQILSGVGTNGREDDIRKGGGGVCTYV
jgi:hypothetical protein